MSVELTAYNMTKTVEQWAADPISSVDAAEIERRIRMGWAPEKAVSEPGGQRKHSRWRGVTWHSKKSRWMAQVRFNGKVECIGYYTDERDAARAFNIRAKELRGTDAKLNRGV